MHSYIHMDAMREEIKGLKCAPFSHRLGSVEMSEVARSAVNSDMSGCKSV